MFGTISQERNQSKTTGWRVLDYQISKKLFIPFNLVIPASGNPKKLSQNADERAGHSFIYSS